MKLHAPFVQLPISFDAQRMAEEIAALGEAPWRPHPQNFAGNSMLPLVAVNGESGNEHFNGPMRPTAELLKCRYLQQVLASFGATVGRTRLMRLSGGAEVTRHADQFYYWTERVRVHVPIVTQPSVRFECGDAALNMQPGECWIFDTWRQHRVLNDDTRSRIHLVCDTVGGEDFWKLVGRGRAVDIAVEREGWKPEPVTYDPASAPVLKLESHNLPVVMSPWELERHLNFLVDEMTPSPQQAAMRQRVGTLYRDWRGLWAEQADSSGAIPGYRRLLEQFMGEARVLVGNSLLRNELATFPAFIAGVARVAVTEDPSSATPSALPYRH